MSELRNLNIFGNQYPILCLSSDHTQIFKPSQAQTLYEKNCECGENLILVNVPNDADFASLVKLSLLQNFYCNLLTKLKGKRLN